jgi:ATP-binding cassette, subfamily C (CFTR/MRP), member 1
MTTVIIALPSIAGALASFGRIQDYLNSTERIDQRVIGSRRPPGIEEDIDKDTEKAQSFSGSEDAGERKIDDLIASMQGKFFGAEGEKPIIDITRWDIQRGSFTLVLGPVGCGKSTLLKALLGELSSFRGVIRTWSTDIAYCEQDAWLPNCTVKEAIIGDYDYNSPFYEKVLQICALQQDIQGWPNGDDSSIGSKGISMSGGQKQRLVS